jgi:1-acyl-sn-glycerol-3-phosphate acyltransferase
MNNTTMHRTLFNTPLVSPLLKLSSRLGLKLAGWKTEGKPPTEKSYVLVAAPHESNVDLVLLLAIAFVLDFKLYWMGKDSLFKGLLAPVMRWLGGVPVDRSKANNLVEQMVGQFEHNRELVLTVTPEGTRSQVDRWKTGFYHIARGANVPIALGFVDYKNKIGGFGPICYPCGDIDKDLENIQLFYSTKIGRTRLKEQRKTNVS